MAGWLVAAVHVVAIVGVFMLVAQILAWRSWPRREPPAASLPPISILKPLFREGPRLYECLRSFCRQDYPVYEVVFGVQDPEDPAIEVVRRLKAEFPDRALTLVVDPTRHGGNAKVGNLANLMSHVRHDVLVLADADILVGEDYLRRLAGPVQDPKVGIVTCLYRGAPLGRVWDQLGALFIQDWFVPQVLLAKTLGSTDFAFGATIALRRSTLTAVGGFDVLASQLADDYHLGARTRALGLRTVLSSYRVETVVDEPRFADLAVHQLRWLRTIRLINPWGYFFSGITFGVPITLVAALIVERADMWALAFLAMLLRLVLHFEACRHQGVRRHFGLVPLADALLWSLWVAGLTGRTVRWHTTVLAVGEDGTIKANRE